MTDDADHIRRLLVDRLESVLDRFWPHWIKRGSLAYCAPKNQKDLGSFQVCLSRTGRKDRGEWNRFSQRIGGDVINLVSYGVTGEATHRDYAAAFREARAFLGIREREPESEDQRRRREQAKQEAEARRKREEAEQAAYRSRRATQAADVLAGCRPIAGTLAEAYLHHRGLPTPPMGWPDCLLFSPSLYYELDGQDRCYPALVARVDDCSGELVAVWRIYLSADGKGKARVEKPKVGLGPALGGAVRIGGLGPRVGIAEGVESALAAWCLIGFRYPVWAALSTSGLAGIELPIEVARVSIFPDGDRPCRLMNGEYVACEPPGIHAARSLRDRLTPTGIKVTIEQEPAVGTDYADVWASRRAMEAA